MADDNEGFRPAREESSTPKGADTPWLSKYEGLGLTEAKERAESEGRRYRVIRPRSTITLDLRPDRLNLWVDADGHLTRMRAS